MNKKSFYLYFFIVCFPLSIVAQNYTTPPNIPEFDLRKWHFGFTLGTELQNTKISNNSMSVIDMPNLTIPDPSDENGEVTGIYYYSEVPKLSTGFHVGIITSRRLGEYLNLRVIPSLSLGEKTVLSKMYVEELTSDGDQILYPNENTVEETVVKSTYISCPVLIKYKAVRIDNFRPYMIAGANIKYDLAVDYDQAITLNRLDASLELGLGSDFYLQTFRLGVEVRFGIGLLNTLHSDRPENDPMPYITASMDKITAKTFTIAINFE